MENPGFKSREDALNDLLKLAKRVRGRDPSLLENILDDKHLTAEQRRLVEVAKTSRDFIKTKELVQSYRDAEEAARRCFVKQGAIARDQQAFNRRLDSGDTTPEQKSELNKKINELEDQWNRTEEERRANLKLQDQIIEELNKRGRHPEDEEFQSIKPNLPIE